MKQTAKIYFLAVKSEVFGGRDGYIQPGLSSDGFLFWSLRVLVTYIQPRLSSDGFFFLVTKSGGHLHQHRLSKLSKSGLLDKRHK